MELVPIDVSTYSELSLWKQCSLICCKSFNYLHTYTSLCWMCVRNLFKCSDCFSLFEKSRRLIERKLFGLPSLHYACTYVCTLCVLRFLFYSILARLLHENQFDIHSNNWYQTCFVLSYSLSPFLVRSIFLFASFSSFEWCGTSEFHWFKMTFPIEYIYIVKM